MTIQFSVRRKLHVNAKMKPNYKCSNRNNLLRFLRWLLDDLLKTIKRYGLFFLIYYKPIPATFYCFYIAHLC